MGTTEMWEQKKQREYPLLSRAEIEALIADGRYIFILDQFVVKADAWLKYHPGGEKAIAHMVGRDATDEVTALHSAEARRMMDRYRIGRIEGRWLNFLPPIQGGRFRRVAKSDMEVTSDSDRCPPIETDSSASSTPRSASPLFDPVESGYRFRSRQRVTTSVTPSSTPASTISSADEEELGNPTKLKEDEVFYDGMTYLDSETRKEIRLDLDKYPSLDGDVQARVVERYRLLNEKIKSEGLYNCNYAAYAIEVSRYTILFGLMLLFLRLGYYALSAFFLGAFWHQLVFSAHDAGHMGITHNFHVDTIIGIIIADFFGGLSLGWWKRNHNVHHIVTNAPEHDPDIEHLPFFAISHRFLLSLRSTYYDRVMKYDAFAKFFVSLQAYLYYIILLFGRFNLYRLSWEYLLLGQAPRKGPAWWHRWLEIAGNVVFWTWFGYGILYRCIPTAWDRFVFVMVSHMVTAPLHLQITLSHFAMSTADLGPAESFPQRMLRTTMDVDCPQWLDFFHGGLQFQAIHHLFPRIPRHNLRRTQRLIQEFCNDVGIPYALYGFVRGNQEVLGRLADVSRQAAILAKCMRVVSGDPVLPHSH
ncbi:hypothetical protein VTK73DRAFT_5432 [Phialemonium thermophilum]|uniref:Delta 8-(E)-sphingolipid desaturase n=1 Tax=Phialemonium thermophilum TaxID=223376 RepID=A0ABR3WP10_9PEZI